MDHIKVRPFLVEEKTGPVNVRLRLLRDAWIHPNFHILMIEPADPETPLQETFHYQPEEEQEFEVERILKRHVTTKGKWLGYLYPQAFPNIETRLPDQGDHVQGSHDL